MTGIDTSVLFAAVVAGGPRHAAAAEFVRSAHEDDDVAISELLLLELYCLLRNPAVVAKPASAGAAAKVCEAFRNHPRWQLLGLPPDSRAFHDRFWPRLRTAGFARRRAFDWRVALSLQLQGVTQFATVNVRDFRGLGFERVFNPLS